MLSTESVRVALEPILSKLCGPMGVTVMARMITGIIMSGVAAYAGAAREHTAVMRRVAAEIKRYCRICHWPMAKLDLLRSSLVHLLASQASKRIVVAVDWTDVQGYSMLVFAVVIGRRTIPFYWVSALWHADHLQIEKEAFEEVKRLLPPGLDCILLADRGFGTTRNLRLLQALNFHFVLRTKWSRILIRRPSRSEEFVAMERITYPAGKVQDLGKVEFTESQPVEVRRVRFRDTGQKGMWVLATNLDAPGRTIVELYARRFRIEETFNDYKDVRSGWQLAGTSSSGRRCWRGCSASPRSPIS